MQPLVSSYSSRLQTGSSRAEAGSYHCTALILFLLLQICGSQKLLDQLIESNKLLDSVQKGLADYLETKRLAFSR